MEFHEAANLFPMMIGDDYAALRDDIKANGLLEPIVTYNGKILDGRNRYTACLDLGIEPRYEACEGDAVAYVISKNLHRRHLTEGQKAVISLDAEKMYAEQNPPGRPQKNKEIIPELTGQARDKAAQLFDVNPHYVSDAKRIANDAPDLLEKVRSGEMTIPQAKREVIKRDRIESPPMPSDKYRVVYADPPWKYGNDGVINNDNYGHVGRHYPSMSIEELCELPIRELVEDDAVLFMWVTSPLLAECWPVIKSWGFTYKTSFVWDKVKHNFGHYNSVRHELLLVCTRGSCTPDNPKLYDSVQAIERSDIHSEKPEEFRNIIDDLYTMGKRIELFARKQVDGWEVWGNEPGQY